MENILQVVQAYFEKPMKNTPFYYSDARLVEVQDGELQYQSLCDSQPLGSSWELLLLDQISSQLCYAHVGYAKDSGYCHEILSFLRLGSGWKLVSILRAPVSSRYSSVCSEPLQESSFMKAIGQILLTYCDAVYNLDADQALSVFTEQAHMLHPIDTVHFADVSCEVFRERWAGCPHPTTLGIAQYAHIYHIELLNQHTAIAKVGVAKLNDHFNDYLYCVNTGDGWKIAHKLTQSVWVQEMNDRR